jgi:hypothetical protein
VFTYGAEHQRVQQRWYSTYSATGTPSGSPEVTTVYVGAVPYEKETYSPAGGAITVEHKHTLTTPDGRPLALYTERTDSAGNLLATNNQDLVYFHTDHLGSTALTTQANGSVQERLAYDPWGDRRHATTTGTAPNQTLAGSPDAVNALQPGTVAGTPSTDRGYTGPMRDIGTWIVATLG